MMRVLQILGLIFLLSFGPLGFVAGAAVGAAKAPDLAPVVIRTVMECKVGGLAPFGLPHGGASRRGPPDPFGGLLPLR